MWRMIWSNTGNGRRVCAISGECEVKHGVRLPLNLYAETSAIREVPEKFRRLPRQRRCPLRSLNRSAAVA